MPAATGKTITTTGAPRTAPVAAVVARPRMERAAPKALTGCVSAISTCGQASSDYRAGLKAYAEVYEAYQAYLTPADPLAGHCYGSVPASDAESADWLMAPLEDGPQVTDDEVEGCGYLGWLQH